MDDLCDILPSGFRFYPTEEELVSFYLQQKLHGRRQEDLNPVIPVLDIYDFNPWDLPQYSGEQCRIDPQVEEWFFFIPRQEKEAKGGRPNRLTTSGYWKATGSPGWVYSSENRIIGLKRSMVFYQGRARTETMSKTDWKMNEYMTLNPTYHHHLPSSSSSASYYHRDEFTVCRVYKKSKCIRAFDRRPTTLPPPPVPPPPIGRKGQPVYDDDQSISGNSNNNNNNHDQNQAQWTVDNNRVTSSSDNFSSSSNIIVNHNNIDPPPPQTTNNDQEMNMDFCNWNWDSMNWGCTWYGI